MRIAVAAGILLLVGSVYAGVREHAFLNHDDRTMVLENPLLDPALAWPEALRRSFVDTPDGNWIPLTWLSLRLDRVLFGFEAGEMLLENAALHAIAALLLFLALRAATGAGGCSAFAAAVFAVHPLHVQSVAWVSERKDVLAGLCFAALLLAWTHYARRPRPSRYAVALGLLAAGLLAKPPLVTAPAVLLLLEWWPLGRLQRAGERRLALIDKLPLAALSLASAWLTYRSQQAFGSMHFGSALPLGVRLANASESLVWYAAQSFWPNGIAAFHPHPAAGISLASAGASALALLGVTAFAFAQREARPYLLVGWLWFAGMLVPVSGLVQVGLHARAERYSYLPQIGLTLMLAWGAAGLAGAGRRGRALVAGSALLAVALLAANARREVGYWRDTRTLFERALAVTRENFYAEQVLASLELEAGRAALAEQGYRRALALAPGSAHAHLGLGAALAEQGKQAEAIAALREGLSIAPHAGGMVQLAALLGQRGELAEALALLDRASAAGDRSSAAQLARAALLRRAGRGGEARDLLAALVAREPGSRQASLELAWLLASCAEPELRDARAAQRLAAPFAAAHAPRGPRALDVFAASLAAAGETARAVEVAREAEALALAQRAPEAQHRAIAARRQRYERGEAIAEPCTAPREEEAR